MDNLLDVQIPDTVVSIGDSAFAGNDNLNKLEISDNVTSIGDYAFGLNSKMLVKSDFECVCSSVSFAQSWCLKNYVPFTTEFVGNSQTVNINVNKSNTIGPLFLRRIVILHFILLQNPIQRV